MQHEHKAGSERTPGARHGRPVTPPPASALLALQRTAGNRAVELAVQRNIFDWFRKKPKISGPTNGRTMTPQEQGGALSGKEVESKKKEDDRGLAGSKLTGAFAEAVLVYWRDPANADKPLKDLAEFMVEAANAELRVFGSYPCYSDASASGDDSGSFSRTTWKIAMNPAKFTTTRATKVSEITQADLAEVVDTVYHEARHSEQYFRIARIQAGSGKSAGQIKTGMSIPADVAKEAFEAPLKDEAPNKELIKEAAAWEAFTIGKYGEYKLKVAAVRDLHSALATLFKAYDAGNKRRTWDAMRPRRRSLENLFATWFEPKIEEVERLTPKDKADDTVLADMKAMRDTWLPLKAEMVASRPSITELRKLRNACYEARYTAYMNYEHEKDAWAAGGGAGKAFKQAANKPVSAASK